MSDDNLPQEITRLPLAVRHYSRYLYLLHRSLNCMPDSRTHKKYIKLARQAKVEALEQINTTKTFLEKA